MRFELNQVKVELTMFRQTNTSFCRWRCTTGVFALSAMFLWSLRGATHSLRGQSNGDRYNACLWVRCSRRRCKSCRCKQLIGERRRNFQNLDLHKLVNFFATNQHWTSFDHYNIFRNFRKSKSSAWNIAKLFPKNTIFTCEDARKTNKQRCCLLMKADTLRSDREWAQRGRSNMSGLVFTSIRTFHIKLSVLQGYRVVTRLEVNFVVAKLESHDVASALWR